MHPLKLPVGWNPIGAFVSTRGGMQILANSLFPCRSSCYIPHCFQRFANSHEIQRPLEERGKARFRILLSFRTSYDYSICHFCDNPIMVVRLVWKSEYYTPVPVSICELLEGRHQNDQLLAGWFHAYLLTSKSRCMQWGVHRITPLFI